MATKHMRLQLEVTFTSLEAKNNFERRLEAAGVLLAQHGHKRGTYGLLNRLLKCVEKSTEPGHCSEVPAHFCLLQVTNITCAMLLHG